MHRVTPAERHEMHLIQVDGTGARLVFIANTHIVSAWSAVRPSPGLAHYNKSGGAGVYFHAVAGAGKESLDRR